MFRPDNFAAVVSGLALEGGYDEFWPLIQKQVWTHALKVFVCVSIFTYLKSTNRAIGYCYVDDKIFYKTILFISVLGFVYVYRRCQKLVTSGLIFHLHNVLMNNLALTTDINAWNVLFNQLDDAICLGSENNRIYRAELHQKPLSIEGENVPDTPHTLFSLRSTAKNLCQKALSVASVPCEKLCSLALATTLSIQQLASLLRSHVVKCFEPVMEPIFRYRRILSKIAEKITSAWKRADSKQPRSSVKLAPRSRYRSKSPKYSYNLK